MLGWRLSRKILVPGYPRAGTPRSRHTFYFESRYYVFFIFNMHTLGKKEESSYPAVCIINIRLIPPGVPGGFYTPGTVPGYPGMHELKYGR